MKMFWIALAIANVALSPGLALASKSKTNCTDEECVKETKLGPWESHEFRGACKGNTPRYQYCSPAGPNVTCTVSVPWDPGGYYTCSCTNWSTTAKHRATATIGCNK